MVIDQVVIQVNFYVVAGTGRETFEQAAHGGGVAARTQVVQVGCKSRKAGAEEALI